ncbi:hypothetical protein JCM11641_005531 [Rhodosporidiobolus odoratus]
MIGSAPFANCDSTRRLPSRHAGQSSPDNSSSDDVRRRRSSLKPGSVVADYFDLDFSFLDDEPPPRQSTFSSALLPFGTSRRTGRQESLGTSGDCGGRNNDSYDTRAISGALPFFSDKRRSTGSTHSLPFPRVRSSTLPFPARPSNPRSVSSDATAGHKSLGHSSDEARPFLPSRLSPHLDACRPYVASVLSAGSAGTGSSAPNSMRLPRLSPPLVFPAPMVMGLDAEEKRKRLAAFLNETASAMEGGKSLAMVLPETQPALAEQKSLAELAEESAESPRTISRSSTRGGIEYRHPFQAGTAPPLPAALDEGLSPTSGSQCTFRPEAYGDPPSPTTAEPSGAIRPREELGPRRTVYFTPDLSDLSPPLPAGTAENGRYDGDKSGQTGMHDGEPAGLGFAGIEIKPSGALRPASEHSPSTVRAGSPSLPASIQPASSKSTQEVWAKKLEKRRRVIRELVETETSYAVDMAVVRDIYLARGRGAHMAQIADHVMSTGLGLGHVGNASLASPAIGSSSILEGRRSSSMPHLDRRTSTGMSSKLEQRRPTVVPSLPNLMPGQPLMASKDLHIVFANLEEIAALAEGFANLLDSASGSCDPEAMDDQIGEVFVEMIPRIQQVYSTYCARHHRAIVRLNELEPSLRTYFSECKTLSHGRTNAWDLASLLIKPVQRCLKYPLLLDQILAVTPEDHPDYPLLKRANTDMLMVAEHINETKKKLEVVDRVVNKDKHSQRRDASRASISSTVTKKLLRSSQKAKSAMGFSEQQGDDQLFDTLCALVDSTRSGVLRFSNEMRDWTKSTRTALEAQVAMVEGWIDMYAPMAGEHNAASMSHQRLCIFLDEVIIPIIEGPWRELDHEVRRSLVLKTDHLLSLFESPRQVIAKRNDKMLDYHRYLAKKLPSDKRGSEDFLVLSSQLLEELPRFLGSVSRYFNIIVGHFAGAQAAYHEAVQEQWNSFAEQWLEQISGNSYDDIEASFAAQHQPLAQMIDTLAAGLGLVASQGEAPSSRKRSSRLSRMSTVSATADPTSSRLTLSHQPRQPSETRPPQNRQSLVSVTSDYFSDRRETRGSLGSTTRGSVTSDSSAPSLGPASTHGSISPSGLVSPPLFPLQHRQHTKQALVDSARPKGVVVHEPLGGHDRRSMAIRYDAPLPSVPQYQVSPLDPTSEMAHSSSAAGNDSRIAYRESLDVPRLREVPGRTASDLRDKYLSSYSVYMPAEDGYAEEEEFNQEGPLYIAEAMAASGAEAGSFRNGYPLLAFEMTDRLEVELEEADSLEGGSGWLLGRLVGGDGRLGWARTEHFVMVEDEDQEEEEEGGLGEAQ